MGINNKTNRGIADDRGTTKPFWCLICGMGFGSPEQTLKHIAEAKHQNESISMGSRGLSKKHGGDAFRLMNR